MFSATIVKQGTSIIRKFIVTHETELLLGAGIASFTTATVMAVRATPDVLDNILIRERVIMSDPDEVERRAAKKTSESPFKMDLTFKEAFKEMWKLYLPAAGAYAIGIACIVGSGVLYSKKIAAIGAAYAISEQALTTYQQGIADAGKDVAEKVRDKIASKQLEENPVPDKKDIPMSLGTGTTLCFDPMIGRYYYSDLETHRRIVNDVNERINIDGCVYWSYYYELLSNLVPDIEVPEFSENFLWEDLMQLATTSRIAPDGTPALVISFANHPVYRSDDMYGL